MADVSSPPDSPSEFVEVFLPELVARSGLPPRSSIGSLTLRVLDAGEWSLRLDAGSLVVTRGMEDDVVVQLTASAPDFGALVVESARRATDPAKAGRALLKALALDAEAARLIRHVPGSILLEARNEPATHRLLLSPGRRAASLDSAECTITCALEDLVAVQAGTVRGFDLFTNGKLQVTGNVQLALALSGLFV